MKKLAIPIFIPLKNNKVDYDMLNNIIKGIDNCTVLIGDYGLNNLSELDYINVYLYLNIINSNNEYYYEKKYNDNLINYFENANNMYVVSKLGNILSNEINEYLENEELNVVDKSLNQYLKMFQKLINDKKEIIEYVLYQKGKIKDKVLKEIDNLLGINEI